MQAKCVVGKGMVFGLFCVWSNETIIPNKYILQKDGAASFLTFPFDPKTLAAEAISIAPLTGASKMTKTPSARCGAGRGKAKEAKAALAKKVENGVQCL